jgi:hypothetical protein
MVQNCRDEDKDETPQKEMTTTFEFYKSSQAWQDRFKKIVHAADENKATDPGSKNKRIFPDLNPYIQNVIMVDGLDENDKGEVKISNVQLERLRLLILTHLKTSLPCVAIGTLRHGNKDGWKDSASLVQAEIPVLYIDVRKRQTYDSCLSHDKLLEAAKAHYKQEWDTMAKAETFDVLDVCRMAFFHSIFFRHDPRNTAKSQIPDTSRVSDDTFVSLCDAIEHAKNSRNPGEPNPTALPTPEKEAVNPQVYSSSRAAAFATFIFELFDLQGSASVVSSREIVSLIVNDQYRSYWGCLHNTLKADLEKAGSTCEIHFAESIQSIWIFAHTLFKSQHFYSKHVEDLKGLGDLLESIVEKDRLPSKELLEGLSVIRSAWNIIDVGHTNLNAYKYLSKFIYLFMLASGITTVCLTVFTDDIDLTMPEIDANMTPTGSMIFYLSVASTFVTAFNAYINPSGRWRQIRDTTCNLESAIWQYRTRTGLFKMQPNEEDMPTAVLKNAVSHAVDTLISSSDIGQSTSWGRLYSKSVYKHGQYKPLSVHKSLFERLGRSKVSPAPSNLADNHYSPLPPEKYIRYRLKKVVKFYKKRLPNYSRSRNFMSITLMLVTAVGTILAYKQFSSYVSICATTAAAITSWMEYNDVVKKIGRYNGTVSNLESLMLWWKSIPQVEKSVIANVEKLVQTGEQVVLF